MMSRVRSSMRPVCMYWPRVTLGCTWRPARMGSVSFFSRGTRSTTPISLLKEYKREVMRYAVGELASIRRLSINYFSEQDKAILREYRTRWTRRLRRKAACPSFRMNC